MIDPLRRRLRELARRRRGAQSNAALIPATSSGWTPSRSSRPCRWRHRAVGRQGRSSGARSHGADLPPTPPQAPLSVPRRFVDMATLASCHRRHDNGPLLYRLLWRIVHEGRSLLDVASDDDVHARRADGGAGPARRAQDARVRALHAQWKTTSGERYVAWYQPDHLIVAHGGAVLRRSLRQHAVVDPDAGPLRALGRAAR